MDQSACSTGTTKVDGVCVSQKIADYVGCVRARGANLKQDKSSTLTLEAEHAATKASAVSDLKDTLERKYEAASDAGELQIISDCYKVALGQDVPPREAVAEPMPRHDVDVGKITVGDNSKVSAGSQDAPGDSSTKIDEIKTGDNSEVDVQ